MNKMVGKHDIKIQDLQTTTLGLPQFSGIPRAVRMLVPNKGLAGLAVCTVGSGLKSRWKSG